MVNLLKTDCHQTYTLLFECKTITIIFKLNTKVFSSDAVFQRMHYYHVCKQCKYVYTASGFIFLKKVSNILNKTNCTQTQEASGSQQR